MSKNIVLETKNIWKKIGHHAIVNDVSLKLYEGDILGFIGPNGAGKTTTIKLMLGLQNLNGGIVKISNFDLKEEFAKAISNVGAIIENPDHYMYMSGYDNLKIAAKLYKVPESRILEVTKIVGLEDKIYDKVKNYSLGMRQRLGIAQAIIHKPRLLILDEPMNGLDPDGIKDLKELLKRLASEEKMAILVSSHLLSELENFCNRIAILYKGKIIKDLEFNEINTYQVKSDYILELSNINIKNILYHYEVIDDYHVKINITKDEMSNILKALLLNDIDIYEIKKVANSLESVYLRITKDKND